MTILLPNEGNKSEVVRFGHTAKDCGLETPASSAEASAAPKPGSARLVPKCWKSGLAEGACCRGLALA